jgi:hypothetical protein
MQSYNNALQRSFVMYKAEKMQYTNFGTDISRALYESGCLLG